MSEIESACGRVDRRLESGETMPGGLEAELREHLAGCERCRRQLEAHLALREAFAAEPVPELSPGFGPALERRLRAARRPGRRPLKGWRLAALAAYLVAGGSLVLPPMARALERLAESEPLALVVLALVLVPLSLALAAVATRWMPDRAPISAGSPPRPLALGL